MALQHPNQQSLPNSEPVWALRHFPTSNTKESKAFFYQYFGDTKLKKPIRFKVIDLRNFLVLSRSIYWGPFYRSAPQKPVGVGTTLDQLKIFIPVLFDTLLTIFVGSQNGQLEGCLPVPRIRNWLHFFLPLSPLLCAIIQFWQHAHLLLLLLWLAFFLDRLDC